MDKLFGVAIGLGIGAVAVATSFYAGVFYGACVMDDAYRDDNDDVKDVARDYSKMFARVVHDVEDVARDYSKMFARVVHDSKNV